MRYRALPKSAAQTGLSRRSTRRWRGDLEILDERKLLATFVVNNYGSDPLTQGTLAWAITQSNATSGVKDTIEFNLAGFGPYRIALSQALPAVTDAVIIDGTTQPGFNPLDPHPVVEIYGGFIPIPPNFTPGSETDGLSIATGLGLGASSGTLIRGLAVGGFNGAGIVVTDSMDVAIEGSHLGVDAFGNRYPDGSNSMKNCSAGVVVRNSQSIRIGGTTEREMNVISGNGSSGIVFVSVTGGTIQGNRIGVDRVNLGSLPNMMDGVNLTDSTGVLVGIATPTTPNPSPLPPPGSGSPGEFLTFPAGENVIASNGRDGIVVWGPAASGVTPPSSFTNRILNNRIGLDDYRQVDGSGTVTAILPRGNGGNGVTIGNSAAGTLVQQNLIQSNGENGVAILSGNFNALYANEYYLNQGIGIDLNYDGRTANDPLDDDLGANQNINFPNLFSAQSDALATTVTGQYESVPNSVFTIQIYTNPSGFSPTSVQGRSYLGYMTVTTDDDGVANFTFVTTYALGIGERVTAIAADSNGNTSEISDFVQVVSAPADIAVGATLNPSTVALGNATIVTTTVTNGSTAVDGVVATVTLPNGFVIPPDGIQVSAGTVSVTGNVVTVTYPGAFGANQSQTIAITLQAASVGTFPITSKVSVNQSDTQPTNNEATVNLVVVASTGVGGGGGSGGGTGGGTGGGSGGGTGGGTGGGSGGTTTQTLPRVANLRRIRQNGRLKVAVTYDMAMDVASVQNASNYYFVVPGRDNKFGTADDRVVGATSAVYDAASMTVYVTPYQPHTIANRPLRISVLGTTTTGVRSASGNALDGLSNGQVSNYQGTVPLLAAAVRKTSLPRGIRGF